MTALLATVTKSAGWLSADTMLTDFRGAMEALRGVVNVVETPSAAPAAGARLVDRPITFGEKLVMVPRMHLAMGFAGSHGAVAAWCSIVAGHQFLHGVAELKLMASELWGMLPPAIRSLPLLGVHVGYDRMTERVVGFWCDAGAGWEPADLEPGHFMHPAPLTNHPDYQELRADWEPAAGGQRTAEFHKKAALNQWWGARNGLVQRDGDGLSIGGQLHQVRVDHAGMHLSVAMQFPDYEEQLERLYIATVGSDG